MQNEKETHSTSHDDHLGQRLTFLLYATHDYNTLTCQSIFAKVL